VNSRCYYAEQSKSGTRIKGKMAEAVVASFLIGTFTSMFVNKVSKEVSLIVNFKKDSEFFREELLSIKRFLTDAGEKSSSSSMSDCLGNLKVFVADAQNLVKQCEAADNILDKLKFRYKMGHKIRELRVRLEEIQRNAQNLNLLASALDVNAHGQARDTDGFNEPSPLDMNAHGQAREVLEDLLENLLENLLQEFLVG